MTSYPKKWKVESLDSLINSGIIKLNRGDIISKRDIAANPGDYPIYSSAKENNGMFGRYGKYMFDEEVITWSIDGGGRLFYREKQKFSVTNVGGILRIIDRSVFDYKFLFYALTYLHSQVIFDWSRKAHPSVIRLVYDKVPIPPLPEQHKIVELLEDHLSRLDAALTEVSRAAEKAKTLTTSIFHQAMMANLESNRTSKFAQEITLQRGFDLPKQNRISGDIPIVASNGEVGRHKIAKVKGPGVVTGRSGTIGRVHLVDEDFWPLNTTLYVKDFHGNDPEFVRYFLLNMQLQNYAGGSTVPSLDRNVLSDLDVSFPEITKQRSIVESVIKGEEQIERIIQLCDFVRNAGFSLRRSLLQAAFSGQLTNEVLSV